MWPPTLLSCNYVLQKKSLQYTFVIYIDIHSPEKTLKNYICDVFQKVGCHITGFPIDIFRFLSVETIETELLSKWMCVCIYFDDIDVQM